MTNLEDVTKAIRGIMTGKGEDSTENAFNSRRYKYWVLFSDENNIRELYQSRLNNLFTPGKTLLTNKRIHIISYILSLLTGGLFSMACPANHVLISEA